MKIYIKIILKHHIREKMLKIILRLIILKINLPWAKFRYQNWIYCIEILIIVTSFLQKIKDVIKRELEYSNFLYKYNNNINYYFYL
jgi:hypothetical protein